MIAPARIVATPLPADIVERLDGYVIRNAVSREAIIVAALTMFLGTWEQMGRLEGAE